MENSFTIRKFDTSEIWNIKCDGFFRSMVSRQLLEDEMPADAVDTIFDNAVSLLSQCPNPSTSNPEGKTGIIIGKVQSGKTSNFIALTAMSFDNQYGINIVLGGNKNNLLSQNAKRIMGYYKDVPHDRLVVLTTTDNKKLINASTLIKFLNEGRKIIIVALKHQKHINYISEVFNNDYLASVPTLIIDDEGDQATLNTKPTNGMSAIYEAVINLKAKVDKHCFISITATPQANILIDTCDKLSPDFGELVYPGEDYCGLDEFHGENESIYVKTIPETEISLIEDEGVPESFYRALAIFFVGGGLRRYRDDYDKHAMLIHPSQKTYDHQKVIVKVSKVLEKWQDQATHYSDGIRDISYESLINLLKEGYKSLKDDNVNLPEYKQLEPFIIECIKTCSPVHLCNSIDDASVNAEYYRTNIFVGGNMLERGITIKGLTVTYIIRRASGASNADNTEQRARWFGYKRKYLDVCRVFTTQSIRQDFIDIREHDQDLWDSMERSKKAGLEFKEIPRIFVLANENLRLTRPNVAKAKRMAYSEWSKQDYIELDKAIADKNTNLVKYFKQNKANLLADYYSHKIIHELNYEDVLDELLTQTVYPSNSKIDNVFFSNLNSALKKAGIDNPIVDIVFMRDGIFQTRSLRLDGSINQLFQGRNPGDNSDLYPGDGAIIRMDRANYLQLQIHFVKPKNKPEIDFYSLAYALYVPRVYAEAMNKLLVKE